MGDADGEPVISAVISGITNEEEGLVRCNDETRHGLQDKDFVTCQGIKGMEGLNGCPPREIRVMGPYSFTIGDTRGKLAGKCVMLY